MRQRILCLFAKAPRPGAVKTRLSPPLTAAQAADLYAAMLLDVVDVSARLEGMELALWHDPPQARDWFAQHVPSRFRLLPQRGQGLGERMAALFETHAAEGFDRIVLRGTDSPTLPPERIHEAFDALEDVNVVTCPDLDGGYNLIGLRAAHSQLFELEMSTESVLSQTREQARRAGLSWSELPPHHDVDVAEDLDRLRGEKAERIAPRTYAWLQRQRHS
jgi:rSAM/selenodomain-associated transferase 1